MLSNLGYIAYQQGDYEGTEVCHYLAEVRLGQGDPEEALALARRALKLVEAFNAPKYVAMTWRVLAEIAVLLPEPPMVTEEVCTPEFMQAPDLTRSSTWEWQGSARGRCGAELVGRYQMGMANAERRCSRKPRRLQQALICSSLRLRR